MGTAQGGDELTAALALSEIGYTWRNAGEVARGTLLLHEAAAEARALGALDDAARWSEEFGDLSAHASVSTQLSQAGWLLERDPEQALMIARRCVKIAVNADNAIVEAQARNTMGAAFSKLGASRQAMAAFEAAALAAGRAGDVTSQFHVKANQADELFRHGHRAQFDEQSAAAIRVGEGLRRSADTGETRQVVVARLYDRLATAAATTFTEPNGAQILPAPVRVLELSQEMRGRNLLRWLSIRPLLDAQARAEQALRQIAGSELMAVAGTADPVVFDTDALADALRPDECLVDVLSLHDVFAITCLMPDGELRTAAYNGTPVSRRSALVALKAARSALLRADRAGTAAAQEDAYAAASEPIDELVALVAEELTPRGPFKRIFVSPQMELAALPWWRLGRRLGSVEICVLPAPGALALLRRRPPDPYPLRRLIAIPDATGSLRNADRDVSLVAHRRCPPDADAILAALPAASAIHFGGHGHYDEQNAYYSGLVVGTAQAPDQLARTYDPDPPDLALLTAAQLLARTDMPGCDLAVLAACSTGIPRQHAANEFTSLPSAFMLAGARAVVASLWVTSDAATALLMQDFYAGISHGRDPAAALAAARNALRSMTRDEVVSRLGSAQFVPPIPVPFARDVYTEAFQYYGTD